MFSGYYIMVVTACSLIKAGACDPSHADVQWLLTARSGCCWMLFDTKAGVALHTDVQWLLTARWLQDSLRSFLPSYLVQSAKYMTHNHCLFSLSATRVTFLLLKQLTNLFLQYTIKKCHIHIVTICHNPHISITSKWPAQTLVCWLNQFAMQLVMHHLLAIIQSRT